MKYQFRFAGITAFATLFLIAASCASAAPKVVKVPPAAVPFEIAARYNISLNGFDLGTLEFNAHVQRGTYTADSDVRLSALLGAFKWRGLTRTSGVVSGAAHRPQGYSFEFDGASRKGSVRMGFSGTELTSLAVVPSSPPSAGTIPLERKHLEGALDPLSAILTMSRADGDGPCGRTLGIFDGKQRFDLALSFRRKEPISGGPDGEVATAIVCRVKYTPVAGHRPNAETDALAANSGIEIAFRPVPAAGLMVPHRVVIPTMAGDAVIEAERVDISTGGRGEVAQAD